MARTSIKQTGMYTKAEVAKIIFPHLPARQGWKKISLAFEGNEYLRDLFRSHRHHVYYSEFKYIHESL